MNLHKLGEPVGMGDIHVELVRPTMRFGLWLQIYAAKYGKVWHAAVKDGDLVFSEVEQGTYPSRPTLELDDQLAELLLRALNNEPIYTKGQAAADHLKDAITVRDRLLTLVESHTYQHLSTPPNMQGRV